MNFTKKLEETGRGYRFVAKANRPLKLVPPTHVLANDEMYASDEYIDRWIEKLVIAGQGTRAKIEAAIMSRIADVASGYEDDMIDEVTA